MAEARSREFTDRIDALRIRLVRMRDRNEPSVALFVRDRDEFHRQGEKFTSAMKLLDRVVALQFKFK